MVLLILRHEKIGLPYARPDQQVDSAQVQPARPVKAFNS